jgi:histidinol phosphatase-like enzyme (inositol monophosphatase family)
MIETPASFAAFARSLAEAARAETLSVAAGVARVENKAKGGAFDPVTEADKAAERAMRRLIEREFPDHGIDGEEFERRPAKGRWRWSLDPIDGTRAFVCGLPGWTTLIALIDDDEPVLGVIDAPRLDELYLGFGDRASLLAGGSEREIATSGCPRLAEARLSTTDPFLFCETESEGFERLRRAARLTRYGWDGYAYARLAAGSLDLVVESGLKPHDYLALVPLIRAAGGAVANWNGGTDLSDGRIVAAASRALLEDAIAFLA